MLTQNDLALPNNRLCHFPMFANIFRLQNGAHINMQDYSGRTSIFHAVKQGHQSAVNLLATYGADVNIR